MRSPIAAILSVTDNPTLLTNSLSVLVHRVRGCPSAFLSIPKQEELIGRFIVPQFTIRHIRLPVCTRPVCAMVHYIISRAGIEGDVAWRVSRDLMIQWDRPDI